MKDTMLKNLQYISNEDVHELKELLESDMDVEEYIVSNYDKLMEHWKKEYSMFDIPSGMISIRVNDEEKYVPVGNKIYDANTIFDIASMTKLYTEFVVFAFLEAYHLSLDTKIGDLTTEYSAICNMRIMDLLEFKSTYRTKVDIRNCTNKEDALVALRTAYTLEEKEGYYLYTDLPIMILTDVMELYSGKTYKELFQQYIIDTYHLEDTYLEVDSDCYVTLNARMTNDPKANIMGGYYGHAGVKTTSKDFLKFLSCTLKSPYAYLLTHPSNAIDNLTNLPITSKAIIGNSNISNQEDTSLASRYLPRNGFAIQGSVRCHGETMKFVVDEQEYTVTSCIFLDLYTQLENIRKYEQETGKIITKEYDVDDFGHMIMCDVRSLLSYSGIYKKLTNVVGKARFVEMYNYIKKEALQPK